MSARTRRVAAAAVAVALGLALSGCATQREMYQWGHYEDVIFAAYSKPGSVTPQAEAAQLEKDLAASASKGGLLPPGWHAHLGYVYYQAGKPEFAMRELLAEKAAYPESAVFVDRLIANMTRRGEEQR